jgi:hypothetical protein
VRSDVSRIAEIEDDDNDDDDDDDDGSKEDRRFGILVAVKCMPLLLLVVYGIGGVRGNSGRHS